MLKMHFPPDNGSRAKNGFPQFQPLQLPLLLGLPRGDAGQELCLLALPLEDLPGQDGRGEGALGDVEEAPKTALRG